MEKVKGNGSVIQRDMSVPRSKCRKWELSVSVGKDLATGKYPPVTRRFNGSLSQANAALRELIGEIESGGIIRHGKQRFGAYCDAWLLERAEKVSYDTLIKESRHLRCARLHWEAAYLWEIDAKATERLYRDLQDGKSPSGRELSGTYVNGIAVTLSQMFKDAVADHHMTINPCDIAKRPAVDTKERPTLRIDGIVELVHSLDPRDPSQFVVRTVVRSGMRRGEVIGLDICDLDFENKVIHDWHGTDSLGRRKETKTESSERDLPMTPQLEEDFMIRIAQIEEDFAMVREETGLDFPILTPDTPLVCNEFGERLKPHSVTVWWRRNRVKLGFDGFTVHDMRHSYLTEMARRKTDVKALQNLAGHSRYSTTEDIYVHVDMEDKWDAVRVADW